MIPGFSARKVMEIVIVMGAAPLMPFDCDKTDVCLRVGTCLKRWIQISIL